MPNSTSSSPAHPEAAAAGRLVLASASPRRANLLDRAGVAFDIRPSRIEERPRAGETPTALAERLAREKALDVASVLDPDPPRPVLGSDTIVVAEDGGALGKPRDAEHAVELLGRLVGRTHRVMTAIALAWSDARPVRSRVVVSEVDMRPATKAELVDYVAVGESLDKAGAYALQGEGGRRFVVAVRGSETNVIGLPLEETLALLRRADVPPGGPGVEPA